MCEVGFARSAGRCPELFGADGATKSCLMAAYRFGTCNGRTPGQIFGDWKDGTESKPLPPCPVCKSTTHWCAHIPRHVSLIDDAGLSFRNVALSGVQIDASP